MLEAVAPLVWGLALLRAVRGAALRRRLVTAPAVGGLAGDLHRGWLVREQDALLLVVRASRWRLPLEPPGDDQARRSVWVQQSSGSDAVRTVRAAGPVFRDERGRAVVAGWERSAAEAVVRRRPDRPVRRVRWSAVRPSRLTAATLVLPPVWLLGEDVVRAILGAAPPVTAAAGIVTAAVMAADLALSIGWRVRRPATVTPLLLPRASDRGPWAPERLEQLEVTDLLRLTARSEGRSSMEQGGLRTGLRTGAARWGRTLAVAPSGVAVALLLLALIIPWVVARVVFGTLAVIVLGWVVLETRARRDEVAARRRTAPTTWRTLSEAARARGEDTVLWLLDGDRTPWVVPVRESLPPDAVVDVHGPLQDGSAVEVSWDGAWQVTTGPLRTTTLDDVARARARSAAALRRSWPAGRA